MTTDTSERGLERLICTALTGTSCGPVRQGKSMSLQRQEIRMSCWVKKLIPTSRPLRDGR